MIPTWTTHAREARKHVRFAHRNAVVSLLRYVAHLSATVQEGHHSAPQEQPMTTLAERHKADQDDADRYAPHTDEIDYVASKPIPMVSVRLTDLNTLMHGFNHPGCTALGVRPIQRLRDALDAAKIRNPAWRSL